MAGNNTAKVVVFIVMGAALALGAGIAYMNRQEAPEPKPAQQAQIAETPPPAAAPSPAQPQPEPGAQAPKAESVADPYAASSDPHKVTTGSDAARVAKLGRSVPMEGQQAEAAQGARESAQDDDQPGLPAGLWTVRQPGGERPVPAPATPAAPASEAAAPAAAAAAPAPAAAPAMEPAKPAKAQKPEKPAMAEKAEKAQKPEKPAAPEKKETPAKAPAEAKQAPAKADAADTGAQASGKILEVTAKTVSGALVLTVVTDAPVEKVLTARYKGPTRVVVDVVGHWQGGVKPSLASEADFVEKVRLGMHPDRLRIVFDYRDKQSEGGAEPKVEKQAKGVVITLPPAK
ncbi:AMIN domain-containing protein [Fundidesulfovibrio agrisoli]|uniref:AMIN domain-containing protein n=1 Tax=Fundidesulfovibrio agrisoli TaxID=2922717 RepID=UPI001FAD0493|nr:AMIN domain-containing protein [Fundidesulfovibrio agrisoli]